LGAALHSGGLRGWCWSNEFDRMANDNDNDNDDDDDDDNGLN